MQDQDYLEAVVSIAKDHPGKSVKILSRNNDLNYRHWSLDYFADQVQKQVRRETWYWTRHQIPRPALSASTIHRAKGLEADVVILLEIDAGKFPGPDKTGGRFQIFGDSLKTLLEDEIRLFYVALTRPKETLYILSSTPYVNKTNQKYNFLKLLNPDWLENP